MRLTDQLAALAASALLAACSTPQRPAAASAAAPPAPEAKAAAAATAGRPIAASLADGKQSKVCFTCHAAPGTGTLRGQLEEVS